MEIHFLPGIGNEIGSGFPNRYNAPRIITKPNTTRLARPTSNPNQQAKSNVEHDAVDDVLDVLVVLLGVVAALGTLGVVLDVLIDDPGNGANRLLLDDEFVDDSPVSESKLVSAE